MKRAPGILDVLHILSKTVRVQLFRISEYFLLKYVSFIASLNSILLNVDSRLKGKKLRNVSLFHVL